MLPRLGYFLLRNRASLVGGAAGVACLAPPMLSFTLVRDFDQVKPIDYINLFTGPALAYGVARLAMGSGSLGKGMGSGAVGSGVVGSFMEFRQQRAAHLRGEKVFPYIAQNVFHYQALLTGARVGALGGIGLYLLAAFGMAVGGSLTGGDRQKIAQSYRDLVTYGPAMTVCSGAIAGAAAGTGTARLVSSRMLWG